MFYWICWVKKLSSADHAERLHHFVWKHKADAIFTQVPFLYNSAAAENDQQHGIKKDSVQRKLL